MTHGWPCKLLDPASCDEPATMALVTTVPQLHLELESLGRSAMMLDGLKLPEKDEYEWTVLIERWAVS